MAQRRRRGRGRRRAARRRGRGAVPLRRAAAAHPPQSRAVVKAPQVATVGRRRREQRRRRMRRVREVDEPVGVADVPRLPGASEALEHLADRELLDLDVDPDGGEVRRATRACSTQAGGCTCRGRRAAVGCRRGGGHARDRGRRAGRSPRRGSPGSPGGMNWSVGRPGPPEPALSNTRRASARRSSATFTAWRRRLDANSGRRVLSAK